MSKTERVGRAVELTAKAMRVWGYNVLLTIGLALVVPATASAEGGKSIASAPLVAYGQQQLGNTATGLFMHNSCFFGFEDAYASFWGVNVLAGDELIVDWESVAKETEFFLLPVGTTDYTVAQTSAAATDELPGNNKSQLTYRAPVSGLMPLYFWVCGELDDTGPYAFTANVKHAVFTSLAPRGAIRPTATLLGTATLADGTPVPDGLVFTLTARWGKRGTTSFTTSSSGGALRFAVSMPWAAQQGMVEFQISRPADGSLLETKSAVDDVYVAKAQPLKCRKGKKKRKVNGKVRCVRKNRR